MQNPMTAQEFFDVFRSYNEGVWPLQMIVAVTCASIAFFSFFIGGLRTRVALALLSVLAAWNGVVFFWTYFAPSNPAGWAFGALFMIQALLLAVHAFGSEGEVWFSPSPWAWIGAILVLYSIVFYPLAGMLLGHRYPEIPVLGAAPCPTTIFMIGMMMSAEPFLPRRLFVIPIAWSILGATAVSYGVLEDLGLAVAGLAAAAYWIMRSEVRIPRPSGKGPVLHS